MIQVNTVRREEEIELGKRIRERSKQVDQDPPLGH